MTNRNASSVDATPQLVGRWLATLAVLILLQLPWPRWLIPGADLAAQTGREVVMWLMAALLLLHVLRIERRPLGSLGLRKPDRRTLAWGVGGAAAMVVGMALLYLVAYPALGLTEEEQLGQVQSLPLWLRLGLITRAAVFEELFYRGFAIERLAELTGKRWLAAVLSLLLFTFAHLGYWGWGHLLIAGFGGLVLTVLYLMRRDLGAAMLAHWLTDAVGFLLA